jgi:hypothetical protein
MARHQRASNTTLRLQELYSAAWCKLCIESSCAQFISLWTITKIPSNCKSQISMLNMMPLYPTRRSQLPWLNLCREWLLRIYNVTMRLLARQSLFLFFQGHEATYYGQ